MYWAGQILWHWLSRHPSSSSRATPMNCSETELRKSGIFLSALFISALGFNVNVQIFMAIFAAGIYLLWITNGDGCGVCQDEYPACRRSCKTNFGRDADCFASLMLRRVLRNHLKCIKLTQNGVVAKFKATFVSHLYPNGNHYQDHSSKHFEFPNMSYLFMINSSQIEDCTVLTFHLENTNNDE